MSETPIFEAVAREFTRRRFAQALRQARLLAYEADCDLAVLAARREQETRPPLRLVKTGRGE